MGIYTNNSAVYTSTDYTSVEPFEGDRFNYHELGIIAAAESAANQNAFMKAIALQELAAIEENGDTDVLYESVSIKSIFEKIKAFFKKIIEKIHKIFHTFIAKMASWFGNNRSFAKKYEKEIVKNWAQVSNDFEFKGYIYDISKNKSEALQALDNVKSEMKDASDDLKEAIATCNLTSYLTSKNKTKSSAEDEIKRAREKLEETKDAIRAKMIRDIGGTNSSSLDAKEFTEELFKTFRNGEDSKEDLNKNKVLESYGGSINGMMTFIKDYDKIKSSLEKGEKAIVKGIDDMIKKLDKEENEIIKRNNEISKANTYGSQLAEDFKKAAIHHNECVVQLSSLFQSILGFQKECAVQVFGAELQATKDACSQAKEIAVKVIGLRKKMTESYDYENEYSSNSGFGRDFISSVKLV